MNIILPEVVAGWLNHCKMMKLSLNFALNEYYEGANTQIAIDLDNWFSESDNKECI